MKPFLGSGFDRLGFSSIAAASAIVVAAAQPAFAAPTQITGVDVKATSGGIELQLKTRFGDRPQVFSAPRGNSWVADVINTQLSLPGDGVFQQANPAPGIAGIQIVPLDENSIRIIVTGTETRPSGDILSRDGQALTFGILTDSGIAATPAQPSAPITAQEQIAQPQGDPTDPVDVLVPNPQVTIDGQDVAPENLNPTPPFLPRAVAPPVGDIAVSELNFQPTNVDLGTAVRIPRLVLREAPAREVLSLLARAAGLNLAYSPAAGEDGSASSAAEGGDEGPRISLDVENEPVQDVFNAVLRLSGLEGNRNNNTIFVSPKLPNDVKDIVIRSYRLNQSTAANVASFLTSMGAEQSISREVITREIESVEVPGGTDENAPELTETRVTTSNEIDTDRIELEDAIPVLRGVQVIADERTNSITVVGPRNLVSLASAKIAELDLRKRQVAVNVRVLDIDLTNITRAGSSFSFGVGGTRFLTEGGIGVINVDTSGEQGSLVPAGPFLSQAGTGSGAVGASQSNGFSTVVRDFVTQLQANIENGNAKILTDPTIVVQEGQTASVALTEDVVTNLTINRDVTAAGISESIEIETEEAGLTVGVQVDRIDDNGFISMSLSPSIRGIAGTQQFDAGTITLLNDRRLSTGTVRLRDGQGLVLAGIIQDEDRSTVSKVPLLGDLPLLGSLFRRTTRNTGRNEVVIVVTPQVLDDSDRSTFGYAYSPSTETRRALDATTLP